MWFLAGLSGVGSAVGSAAGVGGAAGAAGSAASAAGAIGGAAALASSKAGMMSSLASSMMSGGGGAGFQGVSPGYAQTDQYGGVDYSSGTSPRLFSDVLAEEITKQYMNPRLSTVPPQTVDMEKLGEGQEPLYVPATPRTRLVADEAAQEMRKQVRSPSAAEVASENTPLRRAAGTAADMMAIQSGGVPPTLESRGIYEEPSTYEKILTPFADVSSILQRGQIASRQARLRRADLELQARRDAMSQFKQTFDMTKDVLGRIRSQPLETQEDAFNTFANYFEQNMPGVGGKAIGQALRYEAENAGAIPDSTAEIMRLDPGFAAAFMANPAKASEGLGNPTFWKRLTAAKDTERIPVVRQWIRAAETYLRKNNPDALAAIEKNGIENMGELQALNEMLPEGRNGLQLPGEYLGVIKRNPSDFSDYINTVTFSEEYEKEKARSVAKQRFPTPETGKGVNVLVAGLEPGVQLSPRVSFDGGRTFTDRGRTLRLEDYPGSQIVGTSITGTSVKDVAGAYKEKLEAKGEVEAKGRAAEYAGRIATGVDLLDKLTRAGWRSVGTPGWVAEHVGGVLESVNPPAGKTFTEWVSGVSPEEIGQLRVAARSFAAQTRPVVTGEEGARVSDYEQRLSTQVSKVADPTTGFEQMRGAIGGVMGVWLANHERALIEAGVRLKYDLGTLDGQNAQLRELLNMHFSVRQAVDTLFLLQKQRSWLQRTGFSPVVGGQGG